MDKIRWGILATGNVANNFAQALSHVTDAELMAVASRTEENASQFAQKWGLARHYSKYDDLVYDTDVDGNMIHSEEVAEVWAKPLADGSVAVGLFN